MNCAESEGMCAPCSREVLAEYRGHRNDTAKVDSCLTYGDAHVASGSEAGGVKGGEGGGSINPSIINSFYRFTHFFKLPRVLCFSGGLNSRLNSGSLDAVSRRDDASYTNTQAKKVNPRSRVKPLN